jgi:hypothetical protein
VQYADGYISTLYAAQGTYRKQPYVRYISAFETASDKEPISRGEKQIWAA